MTRNIRKMLYYLSAVHRVFTRRKIQPPPRDTTFDQTFSYRASLINSNNLLK